MLHPHDHTYKNLKNSFNLQKFLPVCNFSHFLPHEQCHIDDTADGSDY